MAESSVYFQIGDKTKIFVSQGKSRTAAWNPPPDGSDVTVIGFDEHFVGRLSERNISPGVYVRPAVIKIRSEHGSEHFVQAMDLVAVRPAIKVPEVALRKGDLPELPFWEGDCVISSKMKETEPQVIMRIDWNFLNEKREDGRPFPIYVCGKTIDAGSYFYAAEDTLTLVKRGNVWRKSMGLPLEFSDFKDEVLFAWKTGQFERVQIFPEFNESELDFYDFALHLIEKGKAHAISCDGLVMPWGLNPCVVRCKDPELGNRVAEATLIAHGRKPENDGIVRKL